jgi:hypothetical protein
MSITSVSSLTSTTPVGSYNHQEHSDNNDKLALALFEFEDPSARAALDPELMEAIAQIKTFDLSGQQQALMLDILLAMKQIRKQNMDLWQEQAISSFEAGTMAAEHQRSQAAQQAITTAVSASASILQSMVELGSTAYALGKANTAVKAAQDEADGIDWSTRANGETADTPRPLDAPPPYSQDATLRDVDGNEIKIEQMPDKKKMDTPTDADVPTDNAANRARAEFLNDAQKAAFMKADMQTRIANSIGTLLASLMKATTASSETRAGNEQADATVQQAIQTYLLNQSQFSQNSAQEIQQYINSIMDYIKSVENARHQAASSIANRA